MAAVIVLAVSLMVLLPHRATAEPAEKSPSAAATGQLNIEGKGIRRLVLLRIVGDPNDSANIPIFQESPRSIENPEHPANQVILERPESTVSLPLGKYMLTGVELDGGFQCIVPSIYFDIDTGAPRARVWERTEFVVRPDKPCSIKVGIPFKPTVIATRKGAPLLLEYRLADAGGHTYFCSEWDKPPAALVDGKIVSGQQMFASRPSEKSPQFTIACNGREIAACLCDHSHAGNFWCSWRVPLSALNGPLSVVASFDLGAYGPNETEPILVEWHWYSHFWPQGAGWVLILLLLILVKENRSWRAWTVLILFFALAELFVPWVGHSNRMPRDELAFFQAIIVAWTAAWLVGPLLSKCRPAIAFLLVLGLALLIGMAVQYSFRQSLLSEPLPLVVFAAMFLPLPTAFALGALCCRRTYRPWRFMLWLIPWLIVGFAVGCALCVAGVLLWGDNLPHSGSSEVLFFLIVAPLVFATFAYLLNLPFMLLAFLCPPYRERFRTVLCLEERLPVSPRG